MIKVLRAKLHGLRVTGADLDYHGSITLDPEICLLAGIYPLEFVYIWNKNNGRRLSTYVLFGEAGSGCCVLNGAAARCCQRGDPLIISAVEYLSGPEQIGARSPRILTFNENNQIVDHLRYVVSSDAQGRPTLAALRVADDSAP
ncbi:MAG: aspartate 1-decarboxylase [Candidatus Adiutrix sp.]|jgi:aspartate 1-decarboxylase|nr:aspartate 1-decarboxylase [Candidatus Adiutrix sp.]